MSDHRSGNAFIAILIILKIIIRALNIVPYDLFIYFPFCFNNLKTIVPYENT